MSTKIYRNHFLRAPLWHHVNARGHSVGRLAQQIAHLLMGKHKPSFSRAVAVSDFVVVSNCERVVFTGNKWEHKIYYKHTGYAGGLKQIKAKDMLRKHPDFILYKAVKRMLPHNKLRMERLAKLKIYVGEEHPHQQQLISGRQWNFKCNYLPYDDSKLLETPSLSPTMQLGEPKSPEELKRKGGDIYALKQQEDGTIVFEARRVTGTEPDAPTKKDKMPVSHRMKRIYRFEKLQKTLSEIHEKEEQERTKRAHFPVLVAGELTQPDVPKYDRK
eukprot:TRINITY_DN496_c0_g1_i2.p1 TRINITY_DN496_c0_g1~~TRINITY_DN496_c0_g1_i2.p1  ORF type:complete len:273 (+),score=53.73 TRINITY_DN496_c0_g1_i2:25-843(+)